MIDWTRVDTLFDEIGAEDFCEVVQIFLEESEEVVARLETAPDPACYEADLHFLKGSALNLGFSQVAALCAEGEARSARGEATQVDVGAVAALFRASAQAFSERGQAMCARKTSAA